MVTVRAKRIDNLMTLISKMAPTSLINPKNNKTQHNKFKKRVFNPEFTYLDFNSDLIPMQDALKELKLTEPGLDQLIDKKRKELITKINLLESRGTDDFTFFSQKLFPPPSEKLVAFSYELLKLPPSKKSEKIHRKDAVKILSKVFRQLNLKWKIKATDIISSAQVSNSKRLLELKKRERMSKRYLYRLIIHEIGTHALRYENGRLQPLNMFYSGFANNLETEEGLAAYNEYTYGLMTNSVIRNYAGRVVAVNYSLTHNFKDTYKHLSKYFAPKTAWKLTLRAKRGLSTTRNHGAYTKDVLYLRGFLKVKTYAEKHGTSALYYGKIGLSDLAHIEHMKGLVDLGRSAEVIDISDVDFSKHSVDKVWLNELIKKHGL